MNNNIPQDPFMLLSWVNTQLRDHYPDFKAMCEDLQLDLAALVARFAKAGFEYNHSQNKFW